MDEMGSLRQKKLLFEDGKNGMENGSKGGLKKEVRVFEE